MRIDKGLTYKKMPRLWKTHDTILHDYGLLRSWYDMNLGKYSEPLNMEPLALFSRHILVENVPDSYSG